MEQQAGTSQPPPGQEENVPTGAGLPEVAGISLSLRVPPFWRDKPRLWFISFEAATAELKKSQTQRAQMVVAQLDKQDIEQICDLMYNPSTRQYDAIKQRLISVYEESDERQFQKLLEEMELGDQRPSQLLRRMKNLARDKVSDQTLRLMWMKHLPAHVKSVLAVSDKISTQTDLNDLALLADKMIEQSREISAVTTTPNVGDRHTSDTQYLIAEIRKLSLEIAELKTQNHRNNNWRGRNHYRGRNRSYSRTQSRGNSPSYSHNRSPSHSRTGSPSPYCFYHRKFGANARHCTTPCSFKIENKGN